MNNIVNAWSKKGFQSYEGPKTDDSGEKYEMRALPQSQLSLCQAPIYSPSGDLVAVCSTRGGPVSILDISSNTPVAEIACNNCEHIQFSPLGNYLMTWSRPTKTNPNESLKNNLEIWKIQNEGEEEGGSVVIKSFYQKVYKENAVQITTDEKYIFHSVSNEIHIFNMQENVNEIYCKLYHKGFSVFKIATTPTTVNMAVFNPEANGKPARVSLYQFNSTTNTTTATNTPVAHIQEGVDCKNTRTMFAATDAKCLWNETGDHLLVYTHADVDNTNTSYYGATGLFILSMDGKVSNIVSQSKDGPVYDVQWAPDGQRFLICAGNMPCHTTMYNLKGEAIYEFGAAHRNTISWSPHGRFLCIAGFGNLAGEMDFYDMVKLKKIGSNTAHCTVSFAWSPDSRYFLTATLAPRMNVDNGYKLFKYNGNGPVIHQSYDATEPLYYATWHPRLHTQYPNRGPSPKRPTSSTSSETNDKTTITTTTTNNTTSISTTNTTTKSTPYRPPGSTGALSALLRKDEPVGTVGKLKPIGSGNDAGSQQTKKYTPPARKIPGMPTGPSPAAASSQKKASTGDKKKNSTSAVTSPPPPPQEILATPSTTNPPSIEDTSTSNQQTPANKLKALKKRLKQIQDIKDKIKESSSFQPNPDQMNKLNTESSILEEIALLEKSMT